MTKRTSQLFFELICNSAEDLSKVGQFEGIGVGILRDNKLIVVPGLVRELHLTEEQMELLWEQVMDLHSGGKLLKGSYARRLVSNNGRECGVGGVDIIEYGFDKR